MGNNHLNKTDRNHSLPLVKGKFAGEYILIIIMASENNGTMAILILHL